MTIINDFKYNERYLSDYDCILASFNGGGGFRNAYGTNVSFQTFKSLNSQRNKKYKHSYEDILSSTIQIAKKSCENPTDRIFSEQEVRDILRWLNSEEYHKLQFVSDDFEDIYFMAYFNVQKIMHGDDCIGFELSLVADSSFGYKDLVINDEITDTNKSIVLSLDNDRQCYLMPKIKLKILEDGDLEIYTNTETNRKLILKNCSIGDVIEFDCDNRIINSSNENSNLPSSFNFIFPRFNYSFNNKEYIVNINLNCEVNIELTQEIKIGVI